MSREVLIPEWMFEHFGERFMVAIQPDGTVSVDGGHSDSRGVAKAKELHQSIACIAKPPGTKWAMVTIEAIPEFTGKLNRGAIAELNKIAPAGAREKEGKRG